MNKNKNKYIYIGLLICLSIIIYWVVLNNIYNIEHIYSNDRKHVITVIQYDNFLKDFFHFLLDQDNYESNKYKGIYIIPEKYNCYRPKKNYIYLNFSEGNHYFKWKNDTTYIVLPYSSIKENKLDNDKVILWKDFTKEEKCKYKYFLDNNSFWKYVHQEYTSFNIHDLKKW